MRAGSADTTFFTPNLRGSRRGDNLWHVDMLQEMLNSHATLLVGDAGYRGWAIVVESEANRIEQKFGVEITEEGRVKGQ